MSEQKDPIVSDKMGRVIPPPIQQIPSVGRVVHYYPEEDNTKWAAIITEVNNATNVNLHVFQPGKPAYPLVNVVQGTWRGEWNWPERV